MEGIENRVNVEGFQSTLVGKGAEFVTNLEIVSGGFKMLSYNPKKLVRNGEKDERTWD